MPAPSHLPKTLMVPLLLSLELSSLNSKAMGAAWTLLTVVGWWAIWHTRHKATADTAPWIKTWLIAATLAFVLKTIPTLYWSDPWAERHGEIRLLLGAVAVWGLCRWRPLNTLNAGRMAHALSLSSALGLIWVWTYGRGEVCTHPIPWAVSMAMVSGWLLAMGLHAAHPVKDRNVWLLGGLLAMLAVLASQSRGAFGIVLWWAAALMHQAWLNRRRLLLHRRRLTHALWGTAALLAVIWMLSHTPVLQRPAQSMREAVEQITLSQKSAEVGANSSVGSRLYMWQRSQEAITQSLWIGHGHDGRKQNLARWAEDAHSEEIQKLGHLHNEYLNQLMDHGLWGLASQLAYIVGLMWVARQLLQAQQTTAAMAIGCVCFMHLSSSMSNVNFAHNYYTTTMSLMVMLGLWLAHPAQTKNGPEGPSDLHL